MPVSTCRFVQAVQCPQRLEASDSPQLELQVVVSCPTWVLGTCPLKDQQALLTTESSLQPMILFIYYIFISKTRIHYVVLTGPETGWSWTHRDTPTSAS